MCEHVGVQITQQASANKHPLMKYRVSETVTQDESLHAGQVGGTDLPATSWRAIFSEPRAECVVYFIFLTLLRLAKHLTKTVPRHVKECVKAAACMQNAERSA